MLVLFKVAPITSTVLLNYCFLKSGNKSIIGYKCKGHQQQEVMLPQYTLYGAVPNISNPCTIVSMMEITCRYMYMHLRDIRNFRIGWASWY